MLEFSVCDRRQPLVWIPETCYGFLGSHREGDPSEERLPDHGLKPYPARKR